MGKRQFISITPSCAIRSQRAKRSPATELQPEIELGAAFDNRFRRPHLRGADNNARRVINIPHTESFQFEHFCSTWVLRAKSIPSSLPRARASSNLLPRCSKS